MLVTANAVSGSLSSLLDVGLHLKRSRERLGITQIAMSEAIGIGQTTLSAIERGGLPRQLDSYVEYAIAIRQNPMTILEAVAKAVRQDTDVIVNRLRPATRRVLASEATR